MPLCVFTFTITLEEKAYLYSELKDTIGSPDKSYDVYISAYMCSYIYPRKSFRQNHLTGLSVIRLKGTSRSDGKKHMTLCCGYMMR